MVGTLLNNDKALNTNKLNLSGGTMSGNLNLSYNSKTKLSLITNNEGGNVSIYPPDSVSTTAHWEMDAYNGNFRIFYIDGSVKSSFSFPNTGGNGIIKIKQASYNIGTFTANSTKYDQTFTFTLDTGFVSTGIVGFGLSGENYTQLTIEKLSCRGNIVTWTVSNNTSINILNNITLVIDILEIRETLLA